MADTMIAQPQGGGGGVGGGSVLSGKAVHIKILILCLLCTLVYIYLYSEVSMQTLRIRELMEGTLEDFQEWKDSMETWVHNLKNGEARKHLHKSASKELKTFTSPSNMSVSGRHLILDATDISTAKSKKDYLKRYEQTDIPLLTVFTTWPSKADKYLCHNNTVNNWLSLQPYVVPILFSNESDLVNDVQKKGWLVLPVSKLGGGIPVLKYMFLDAMREVPSHFYGYSNGDILFTDQLVDSLRAILMSESVNKSVPMMVVGQRTNVKDVTYEEASSWENIEKIAKSRGKLFTSYAEDFFITMKNYPWKEIPELVIGRRAYDNWLVLNSRKHKFTTIDITSTSYAVHQTTKAGNYEGHHHKDGNYNHNLLRKLYRRLRYEAGLTTCTDKQTRRTADRQILVQNRKVSKGCYPI